jgi:hypothetical protein
MDFMPHKAAVTENAYAAVLWNLKAIKKDSRR